MELVNANQQHFIARRKELEQVLPRITSDIEQVQRLVELNTTYLIELKSIFKSITHELKSIEVRLEELAKHGVTCQCSYCIDAFKKMGKKNSVEMFSSDAPMEKEALLVESKKTDVARNKTKEEIQALERMSIEALISLPLSEEIKKMINNEELNQQVEKYLKK